MSEDEYPEGLDIQEITITRRLMEGGHDLVITQYDKDAPVIELLGMIEFARATVLQPFYEPEDDDE